MGYTNIYEFGGINTWDGEIVTDLQPSANAKMQPGTTVDIADAVITLPCRCSELGDIRVDTSMLIPANQLYRRGYYGREV